LIISKPPGSINRSREVFLDTPSPKGKVFDYGRSSENAFPFGDSLREDNVFIGRVCGFEAWVFSCLSINLLERKKTEIVFFPNITNL